MSALRVIVIGAGAGGLAAAMELASRGADVTVCERQAVPGGKIRRHRVQNQLIDAGPTVFTMRWVFENLFERCRCDWPDDLQLTPMDILARHAWLDGARFDLFADAERTADGIAALSGNAEARRYLAFTRRARTVYAGLERSFIRAPRPSPIALMRRTSVPGLACLARIAPYATLWRALGAHFHDPRLRQLFARYATYIGSSPYQAPATLMLIAHVERDGVWQVRGGMYRLVNALAGCAERLGARLRFGQGVAQVELRHGRVDAVRLDSGERLAADAVVCNADASAIASGLLGRELVGAVSPAATARRSLSALTWSLVAATEGFDLSHHNVFFSSDYRAEFDALFRAKRLPHTPTVYVCAQDRNGAEPSAPNLPHGQPERLLCLVNAPAGESQGPISRDELAGCERRTFDMLERCGLRVHRRPEACVTTSPSDFEQLFPGTGGALYGAACHGWRASFTRPGARTKVPGLYLAGGSVHPGPGVPMATLSGHNAALSVLNDHTRRAAH